MNYDQNLYDQQSVYNLAQLLQQNPNQATNLAAKGSSGWTQMAKSMGMNALMNSARTQPKDPPTANQVSSLKAGAGPVNANYADALTASNNNALASMAGYNVDPVNNPSLNTASSNKSSY